MAPSTSPIVLYSFTFGCVGNFELPFGMTKKGRPWSEWLVSSPEWLEPVTGIFLEPVAGYAHISGQAGVQVPRAWAIDQLWSLNPVYSHYQLK